ncbi:unnamed protein product [Ranitomeya imitator]|uniref:Uncharacterized protein n=1 Tax=Ranitomeya imitator TaxID=111125 RepID=A0ABN9KXE3_9NEOB|nr:unnamed protein product [Ranitomeya imitator]
MTAYHSHVYQQGPDLDSDCQAPKTRPTPGKVQTSEVYGTRIIYDRKFLLDRRNSPLAQTPPRRLPDIPGVTSPSTVVEEHKVEMNNLNNHDRKTTVESSIILYLFKWGRSEKSVGTLKETILLGIITLGSAFHETVFGPSLDKILEKATDKKKALPQNKNHPRKGFFVLHSPKPLRRKGKNGRWSYPKGGGMNILIPQQQQSQQEKR